MKTNKKHKTSNSPPKNTALNTANLSARFGFSNRSHLLACCTTSSSENVIRLVATPPAAPPPAPPSLVVLTIFRSKLPSTAAGDTWPLSPDLSLPALAISSRRVAPICPYTEYMTVQYVKYSGGKYTREQNVGAVLYSTCPICFALRSTTSAQRDMTKSRVPTWRLAIRILTVISKELPHLVYSTVFNTHAPRCGILKVPFTMRFKVQSPPPRKTGRRGG